MQAPQGSWARAKGELNMSENVEEKNSTTDEELKRELKRKWMRILKRIWMRILKGILKRTLKRNDQNIEDNVSFYACSWCFPAKDGQSPLNWCIPEEGLIDMNGSNLTKSTWLMTSNWKSTKLSPVVNRLDCAGLWTCSNELRGKPGFIESK